MWNKSLQPSIIMPAYPIGPGPVGEDPGGPVVGPEGQAQGLHPRQGPGKDWPTGRVRRQHSAGIITPSLPTAVSY